SVGKGSLWCVCPEYRPALLEVLRKTHSYHSTNSNLINKPEFPDHEELVTMESIDYQQEEVCEELEKDPLSDSGYIELHYYHTQEYLVLPGDHQLDLETVEILQLDAEAQEAAGSLLDLAGGGY
ncbi:hypothetical protein NL108_005236, partial [Boleophthalmus pectinirostris]